MTSLTSLDDLFIDELRDIYSDEQQLIKALAKVSKKVSSTRLAGALPILEQTQGHAEWLGPISEQLREQKGTGKNCKGKEGYLRKVRKYSRRLSTT